MTYAVSTKNGYTQLYPELNYNLLIHTYQIEKYWFTGSPTSAANFVIHCKRNFLNKMSTTDIYRPHTFDKVQ